jgi:hypothetical protein
MFVSTLQGSLDLSGLPEEAKKELIDFYQFLIEKYTDEKNNKNTAQAGKDLEELLHNPDKPEPKRKNLNPCRTERKNRIGMVKDDTYRKIC